MPVIMAKQVMLRHQVSYHTTPELQTCASAAINGEGPATGSKTIDER